MKTATDLLIVGAGMAGLAAAVTAIDLGAHVTVLEKSKSVGGSAALAAGILWGPPDYQTLSDVAPRCDPELGRALVDGFGPAVELVRSAGVAVSDEWFGQMGYGIARHIDITTLLEKWRDAVETRGELLTQCSVRELLIDDTGRVVGARVLRDGQMREIRAKAVLLATGGFQGDAELAQTFLGTNADRLVFRSNPGSVGDGFRLGRSAGAAASGGMSGFYGHLLPSPLGEISAADFLPLTQYYSRSCILVNRDGVRFTDESLGDEISNQALMQQPDARATLLFDEKIRTTEAISAPYPHGQKIDRVALAVDANARVASAASIDELLDIVAKWGVDPAGLSHTLDGYRSGAIEGRAATALTVPPFYAMEVQPSITFTFGGLAVDVDGHVLNRDRIPIPGLFAAGADAGGIQDHRYVGGLILGAVFGPRAARIALSSQ